MLPTDQSRMVEQDKGNYSHLLRTLWKQTKTIEDKKNPFFLSFKTWCSTINN